MTEQPVNLGTVDPSVMTPEQQAAARAVAEAQTPQEYIAAARAAGLVGVADEAAAAGAAPITAPDFTALLEQYKLDQQAQIDKMQADFDAQIASLRAGVPQPLVDPRVSVARNLSDGLALLAASYPAGARREPMARSAKALAEAVAPVDGAATPVPDDATVVSAIKTFRRFAAANPVYETGLLELAAEVAEDLFGL